MLVLTLLLIAGMIGVGYAVNSQSKNRVILTNESGEEILEAEVF